MTRLTRDDLAANPRLRARVADALASDLARRSAPASVPARPARPDLPAGRAGFRCVACGAWNRTWAAAQRHADEQSHPRIALAQIEPQ